MKTCKCGRPARLLLEPQCDFVNKPCGPVFIGSRTELLCDECFRVNRFQFPKDDFYKKTVVRG